MSAAGRNSIPPRCYAIQSFTLQKIVLRLFAQRDELYKLSKNATNSWRWEGERVEKLNV